MKMNYMFIDNASGEEFFVQASSKDAAEQVANFYFVEGDLEYCGEYSDSEAEMIGFDTYTD